MLKPGDVCWLLHPISAQWTLHGSIHWALCNHIVSNGCFLGEAPIGLYHEASNGRFVLEAPIGHCRTPLGHMIIFGKDPAGGNKLVS
jgi:hypothetical protein